MIVPIVTTYSVPNGRETYGRNWYTTAAKYWPEEWLPVVYADDDELKLEHRIDPDEVAKDVERFAAEAPLTATGRVPCPGWTKGDKAIGYSFRFDAVRFAWKAFTLLDAADRFSDMPLWVWLDADVVTTSRPRAQLWNDLLPTNLPVGFLERRKWSETGCLIFRPKTQDYQAFWESYHTAYHDGGIWEMNQWHDAYVFDQCRTRAHNIGTTFEPVFETSPLGRYFRHLKGNQKGTLE